MIRVPDLAHFRQSDEPASVGDTVADLISGIVVMLAIIAFGFDMIGFFS